MAFGLGTVKSKPPPSSGADNPVNEIAERQKLAMAGHMALIKRYTDALVEAGEAAQQQRNGRELAIFEREFSKVEDLVAALVNGNYLDTSCALADIAYSGVRAWMKEFDGGNPRYQTIGKLIRAAEAVAESEAVAMVRSAGNDPRYWTAPATWLERKFPQKYGRRMEETDVPKVVVQIGLTDHDIDRFIVRRRSNDAIDVTPPATLPALLDVSPRPAAVTTAGDRSADGD